MDFVFSDLFLPLQVHNDASRANVAVAEGWQ